MRWPPLLPGSSRGRNARSTALLKVDRHGNGNQNLIRKTFLSLNLSQKQAWTTLMADIIMPDAMKRGVTIFTRLSHGRLRNADQIR